MLLDAIYEKVKRNSRIVVSYLVNGRLQFISCCSRSGRIDALRSDVLQTSCRNVSSMLHTLIRAADRCTCAI